VLDCLAVERCCRRDDGRFFDSSKQISVFICVPLWFMVSPVKLISWNVNGLRAVLRKNFLEYLESESPDVLCLQEIKCGQDDIDQLWPAQYTAFWNCAEKKGY